MPTPFHSLLAHGRLRISSNDDSKPGLISLVDSISSSFGVDELARSLSPSMLRSSRLRSSFPAPRLRSSLLKQTCANSGPSSVSRRTSVMSDTGPSHATAAEERHWWLARTLNTRTPNRPAAKRNVTPSPSRLHQCHGLQNRSTESPPLSHTKDSGSGRNAIGQLLMASARLSPAARTRKCEGHEPADRSTNGCNRNSSVISLS